MATLSQNKSKNYWCRRFILEILLSHLYLATSHSDASDAAARRVLAAGFASCLGYETTPTIEKFEIGVTLLFIGLNWTSNLYLTRKSGSELHNFSLPFFCLFVKPKFSLSILMVLLK